MIEVTSTGPQTTVQDQGRFGYAHLGVPRAGALDAPALARANRLVGNPVGAAGLEITLAATTLTGRVDWRFAVTGAPAEIWVGGRPVEPGRPVVAPAGVPVRVSAPIYGARVYVGIAGGVAVAPVLGSRSTDTLSGLGPPPVRSGDVLPLGARRTGPTATTQRDQPAPGFGDETDDRPGVGQVTHDGSGSSDDTDDVPGEVGTVPVGAGGRAIVVPFAWGPRDDLFTGDGRRALLGAYQIGVDSNRVGVRLRGPRVARVDQRELASEGMVLGAIQVTADGLPLVFLADHPTTGGYPVIGVVGALGVARLAQGRPGDTVIFRRGEE